MDMIDYVSISLGELFAGKTKPYEFSFRKLETKMLEANMFPYICSLIYFMKF